MDTRQSRRSTDPARLVRRIARLAREPRRVPVAVRRRVRSPLVPASARTPAAAPAGPPPRRALTRGQRLAIITEHVDLEHGLGLEIGPSHNPLMPKAEGYNVRIADHLDQAGLVEKYGYLDTTRIEPVDYVLAPGRLTDSIPDTFDYIVASHVLEHSVCLISFLQDCQALLRPGGVLTVALPDKRYCFDRFRERAALGRVIDTYLAAPSVHTPGMVTEHFLFNVTHGGIGSWWPGQPGRYRFVQPLDDVLGLAGAARGGEYVDTHNWVLTPNHFRLLIHDLRLLGYIELGVLGFTDTVDHEFFVSLSRDAGPGPSRADLAAASAQELRDTDVAVFDEPPADQPTVAR